MRRVVVTGMGIVSCLGNSKEAVTASLREGRSGIRFIPEYAEMGFRSHVAGRPEVDFAAQIDRKQLRFMGDAAAFAYIAMQPGHRGRGADRGRGLERAHRHHRRLRRRLLVEPGGSRRHPAREGREARRAVPRDPDHGEHRLGLPGHAVQDQGPELLDRLGLLHQRALHRRRHGADPDGQAGPRLRRRRRGRALDAWPACSTRWARCPPSATPRPSWPRAPTTRTATAS